jgi:uncharacterized protein (DUF1330 family)
MKYLQTFSLFESRTPGTLTPEQEAFLNLYTKGTWSVNSSTGLVDVQGLFHCSGHGLKSLGGIRFGTVTGNFDCRTNQLTTLEGAPRTVEGNFWCNWNQLTTLEGAPRTVEGNFDCYSNKLTTLEGAPRTVGGNFVCHDNKLTTLEGAPRTVEGNFDCYSNKLTTLEGAPRTVGGHFVCHDNKLTTLEGAPRTVEGNFDCYSNKLTTLEGAPQKVGGDFDCYSKKLTTLEGAPQTVTRYFRCYDFILNPGEWNPTGWLQVLQEGSPKAQKLIQTLPYLQPDWWNSELSKDPARTIQLLAPWWSQMSDELKRGIRIPPGYEDRFEMRSELSDLGLF